MAKFMLPYRTVKKGLAELDIRISYLNETSEYRVSPYREGTRVLDHKRQEELSYYTDDLEDAYLTGIKMARDQTQSLYWKAV